MSTSNTDAHKKYWIRSRNLAFAIVAVWFVFAVVVHLFANSFNTFSFMGFPFGYYLAAQGALIVFVLLVFVQNYVQDRFDDNYEASK